MTELKNTVHLNTDILVAGGGAAGMAAAKAASEQGSTVILVEKSPVLGGILNRCTHPGFGLGYYDEEITGQEYAERYREELGSENLTVLTDTTVIAVNEDRTALLVSEGRITEVSFRVLIAASGSYEVPIESVAPEGTRPAGIMTAGCAQGLINENHLEIGSRIIVLGSGNVGQIMAGQLADAGKEIIAIIEKNDAPGGLSRNVREYIKGRNIPLILNSTITKIHGTNRITGVTVKNLLTGEESILSCDTLITALGLIPDRAILDNICTDGIYPDWVILTGNCDRIYDFADAVTASGEQAGLTASLKCRSNK